jgi:hypothetical protein
MGSASVTLQSKPQSYSELAGYVMPGDNCWEVAGGKSYSKLLGKDAPPVVMIEDPHNGDMIKAYPLDAVKAKLKEKGHIVSRSSSPQNEQMRKDEAKAKAERALRRTVLARIHAEARARIEAGSTLTHDDLALIAEYALGRLGHDYEPPVLEMWRPGEKRERASTVIDTAVLTANDLALLLLDVALAQHTHVSIWSTMDMPKTLAGAATRYGVDIAAIKRELAAEAKAKTKGPAKAAAKKATVSKPDDASPSKTKPPTRSTAAGKKAGKPADISAASAAKKAPAAAPADAFANSAWPYPTAASNGADAKKAGIAEATSSIPLSNGPTLELGPGARIRVKDDAKGPNGRRMKVAGRIGTILEYAAHTAQVQFDDGTSHMQVPEACLDLLDPATDAYSTVVETA